MQREGDGFILRNVQGLQLTGCFLCCCRVVFAHSADASSQYIQYKYGNEAGQMAQQSVPVAQDMLDGKQGLAGSAGRCRAAAATRACHG